MCVSGILLDYIVDDINTGKTPTPLIPDVSESLKRLLCVIYNPDLNLGLDRLRSR